MTQKASENQWLTVGFTGDSTSQPQEIQGGFVLLVTFAQL